MIAGARTRARIAGSLAAALLASVSLQAWAQDAAGAQDKAGAQAQPATREAVPADLTTMPPIPNDYAPKKTPWGDPDLTGTWPLNDIAELPIQRPAQYGNRYWKTPEEMAAESKRDQQLETAYKSEADKDTIGIGHWIEYEGGSPRTSMLIDPPDGQLPALTQEGIKRAALGRSSWTPGQTYDWVTDFDSWDRCVSRGFPASMFPFRYNNGIRIFQSPGYVTIQLEMLGNRVIPLSASKQEADKAWPKAVKTWMGDSRGYWEDGNTLVVETSNIQPGAAPLNMATRGVPPNNTVPMSEQATVLEKFYMVGPNTITYEMTYSDPVIWTAPFTTRVNWTRDDSYQFYEYACHEGDVQIRNYITSNRALREAEYKRGRMAEPLAWKAPQPAMDPASAGRRNASNQD